MIGEYVAFVKEQIRQECGDVSESKLDDLVLQKLTQGDKESEEKINLLHEVLHVQILVT